MATLTTNNNHHSNTSFQPYQPNSRSSLMKSELDLPQGKKGMFMQWSSKLKKKDTDSTAGADGSNEESSGSSNSSEHTQKTCNNSGWLSKPDDDDDIQEIDPLYSPKVEKKPALSVSSGHSSQSESPVGVDQYHQVTLEEKAGDGDSECSEDTPKTKPRVSRYFHAAAAVMPLPFGQEDNVPEVTRQISLQFQPLVPHERQTPHVTRSFADHTTPSQRSPPTNGVVKPSDHYDFQHQQSSRDVTQPPEPFPIHSDTSRRRNSYESYGHLNKGEADVQFENRRYSLPREPTIDSIQEEEEFYARGRTLLREPIIPREAYIDPDQRSLSPPTIDTRLQSTVDDSRTIDTRWQSTIDSRTIDTRPTIDSNGSRMHFSVNSRMSQTPKRLPQDPSATIFIPIQPGIKVPLRRCPEVQSALETDFYDVPICSCCDRELAVIADAAFLYCPLCREISPLFGNIRSVGKHPEEPEYLRFGLGLGMTWETVKKVYAEMYPQGNSNNGSNHGSGNNITQDL